MQLVREKLPPTKRVGTRRKKLVHTDSQSKANELLGHLDAADAAIERAAFLDRRWAHADDAERPDLLEQMRAHTHRAWKKQQKARALWEKIRTPPGVVGSASFDPGVEKVLSEYRDWTTTSGKRLEQLDRRIEMLGDEWDQVNQLGNAMPRLFRRLVAARLLTVKNPQGKQYTVGVGNVSKAYYFNETDDWTVHVHRQSHGKHSTGAGEITAHYKPTADEGGLGYNASNPVDPATLRMLNIDVYLT